MKYAQRRAIIAQGEIDGNVVYSSPVVVRDHSRFASKHRAQYLRSEAQRIAELQIRDTYKRHVNDHPDALLANVKFSGVVDVLVPAE